MKWLIPIITALVVVAASTIYTYNRPADLNQLHQGIISDYSRVSHISAEAFDRFNADDIILLDIREVEEFSISHIAGAKQIDPDISKDNLLTQLPDDLTNKTIIVYCSVGRRSTDLAARSKAQLLEKGAKDVVNLEEGIFGWHNENRPLTSAAGTTDYVHPYNEYWKRWVKRKHKARYK